MLAKALTIFEAVDAIVNKIEAATLFVQGVKNRITALLNLFKTATGQTLTTMNVTFNPGAGSSDIPSLLPVNQGGTRETNGTVTDANFVVVRSVSDPFNAVPLSALDTDTVQALAVEAIKKQVEALRLQAAEIIAAINVNGGALEFFDDILSIRQSVVLIQDVFEAGIASSNARIINYTVPRVMSLREVAFTNNVDVNRVRELDLLNPSLLSVNYIEPGTVVKVPVS
jgi:hypothetical protein